MLALALTACSSDDPTTGAGPTTSVTEPAGTTTEPAVAATSSKPSSTPSAPNPTTIELHLLPEREWDLFMVRYRTADSIEVVSTTTDGEDTGHNLFLVQTETWTHRSRGNVELTRSFRSSDTGEHGQIAARIIDGTLYLGPVPEGQEEPDEWTAGPVEELGVEVTGAVGTTDLDALLNGLEPLAVELDDRQNRLFEVEVPIGDLLGLMGLGSTLLSQGVHLDDLKGTHRLSAALEGEGRVLHLELAEELDEIGVAEADALLPWLQWAATVDLAALQRRVQVPEVVVEGDG